MIFKIIEIIMLFISIPSLIFSIVAMQLEIIATMRVIESGGEKKEKAMFSTIRHVDIYRCVLYTFITIWATIVIMMILSFESNTLQHYINNG